MLTQNPSTFLHFPPPFLLDHDEFLHNEVFSHPLIMEDDQIFTSLAVPEEAEIELIESFRKDSTDFQINQRETMIMKEARVYRRREKDRHSKIYTAQGPRDRRMRLSVQVARRFFDLQDMLGFDKASKTIEWLFSKSKGPIKELTEKARHLNRGFPCCLPDTGGDPKPRNSTWFDPVAKKEWRQKARERARERTKEKLKMRSMSSCFTKLSSSSAGTKVQSLCHLVSVLENPENQHHCPNSTLINVANPDAGATINPNNYNFSSPPSLDQSIGHEENQFSFLIRNYIPTSIFGFSTTPAC